MPQFGGLGKALAKEMNVEPEPEPETEQERVDRELRENIAAVVALQTICRAALARKAFLAARQERIRWLAEQKRTEEEAAARRAAEEAARAAEAQRIAEEEAARRAADEKRRKEEADARLVERWAPAVQAQIRGVMQRRELHNKQAELRTSQAQYSKLQAICRGVLARRSHAKTQQRVSAAAPFCFRSRLLTLLQL